MRLLDTNILVFLIMVLITTSCGSQKRALEAQNELLMQQIAMQQQQAAKPVVPSRKLRTLDPCEKLAIAPSENFRASGTAIAGTESEAKNLAAADARNQLAQMIRVQVSGVSQDKSRNTTHNKTVDTRSVGEEQMSQYVYQSLEATKPILWSVYDLSDGRVQAYVCMEMTKKPEEFQKEFMDQFFQPTPTPQFGDMGMGTSSAPLMVAPMNPEAERLYEAGREYCIKNQYDRGMPLLQEAAQMGSANAIYYLGGMYLYGTHVEQDSKKAFELILTAANGSHKEAVFQVAEMYNSGTGTHKDKEQARIWYRRADDLGDTRAESRLRRL